MISWIVRILMLGSGDGGSPPAHVHRGGPGFLAAPLDNRPESFGETALTGSPRGVMGPWLEARGTTSVGI
jgi:hypothetical protein